MFLKWPFWVKRATSLYSYLFFFFHTVCYILPSIVYLPIRVYLKYWTLHFFKIPLVRGVSVRILYSKFPWRWKVKNRKRQKWTKFYRLKLFFCKSKFSLDIPINYNFVKFTVQSKISQKKSFLTNLVIRSVLLLRILM